MMTLEAPEIVILTPLEVSFRLLETMYGTGVTPECHLRSTKYFYTGYTKGGNITVRLTSCLTGLELAE